MKSKMLSLEVPDSLRQALRYRAFENNVSVSKLVRQILEQELSEELAIYHAKQEANNEEC